METIDQNPQALGGEMPRTSSKNGNRNDSTNQAKQRLHGAMHRKKASLTQAEAFFLHSLLVDDPFLSDQKLSEPERNHDERLTNAADVLDDDILFSVPPPEKIEEVEKSEIVKKSGKPDPTKIPPKPRRRPITALWRAHEDGVAPKELVKRGSRSTGELRASTAAALAALRTLDSSSSRDLSEGSNGLPRRRPRRGHRRNLSAGDDSLGRNLSSSSGVPPRPRRHVRHQSAGAETLRNLSTGDMSVEKRDIDASSPRRTLRMSRDSIHSTGNLSLASVGTISTGSWEPYEDIPSDEEVRREDDKDNHTECSSWADDIHYEHFDAWEVLKDEYAQDFGFDFSERGGNAALVDYDENPHTFLILGTSVEDKSSQPHVLSPPLMDALTNFLPDQLVGENFWMKFSLVRDGASLDTMKQYVRASPYTIMAIETDRGEVFGSFTSHTWRNHYGFYGAAPAFVWKMRHSRQTKCVSLFDQAQLESIIDVFMFSGHNEFLQVCRHDMIAIGGDDSLAAMRGEDDLNALDECESFRASHREENFNGRSGFAIALEDDLLRGTTSPCATFKSPSLCGPGSESEIFHVAGLEMWTLTPCRDLESAEKNEMTKFFVEQSYRNLSTQSGASSSIGSQSTNFGQAELIREKFYQRVGQDQDSEERRDRWQYRNMMDGTTGGVNRGLGASPRFGS